MIDPIISTPLKIATWNLRLPFPQDNTIHLSWSQRKDAIASAISQYAPDLLALQEDCYFMNSDLLHHTSISQKGSNVALSHMYHRYGRFNRNGEIYPTSQWPPNAFSPIVGNDGEHNSIWYNQNRLDVLETITFWLSHTPDVPSSFDEVTGRIVNCALFRDRICQMNTIRTSKNIEEKCPNLFYCSTHFTAGNTTRQLYSVEVLSQMFSLHRDKLTKKYKSKNLIMMIGGDFNSSPESETYNAMIRSGFMDVRVLSRERMGMEEYSHTTNDWYGASDDMIDHIWVYKRSRTIREDKGSTNVQSVKHVRIPCCLGKYDLMNRTASDHLMVLIEYNYF